MASGIHDRRGPAPGGAPRFAGASIAGAERARRPRRRTARRRRRRGRRRRAASPSPRSASIAPTAPPGAASRPVVVAASPVVNIVNSVNGDNRRGATPPMSARGAAAATATVDDAPVIAGAPAIGGGPVRAPRESATKSTRTRSQRPGPGRAGRRRAGARARRNGSRCASRRPRRAEQPQSAGALTPFKRPSPSLSIAWHCATGRTRQSTCPSSAASRSTRNGRGRAWLSTLHARSRRGRRRAPRREPQLAAYLRDARVPLASLSIEASGGGRSGGAGGETANQRGARDDGPSSPRGASTPANSSEREGQGVGSGSCCRVACERRSRTPRRRCSAGRRPRRRRLPARRWMRNIMKLLIAQLSHQDPLQPQDGERVVAQLGQQYVDVLRRPYC